ncbi:MAG: hypothetical protein CSA81_05600 [Acidobacteria bacterium]|nr:MAG: hypothetical protein CSA81_05600 [Acidobacteriota bacterium]PIE90936.1 MAG: hypothetical protein CR997_03510 [Acidobacteriota bacterium]
MKIRIFLLFFPLIVFGQNETYDLKDQIGLVKDLMPDVKVIGVIIGEQDESLFNVVVNTSQQDYGIRIVKAIVKKSSTRNLRTLRNLYKKCTLDMLNENAGAILFAFGKDRSIQTTIAIKTVTETAQKSRVPTFTPHKKSLKMGCCGQFIFNDDWWKLKLNSDKLLPNSIEMPLGDDRYLVQ